MSDPTLAGSDFCLLALHVRLGKLQIVEDIGHERGMASLPLDGQEVPDLFAVRCWTAIEVLPGPNSKCESTARKLEKHAYV
jgi:hypothetical protein